ncbi:MAG TPA: hypothetical protein VFZ98_09145 [Vicinamibacterales bacterium]
MLPALAAWQNFYVIVGSSAGALTGLQFVVVALVADLPDTRPFSTSSSAFATPTIVHFGVVLILAAIFSAPWSAVGAPMLLIALGGIAGFAYSAITAVRATQVEQYKPVPEDWIFHVMLPATAYLTMALAAASSRVHTGGALFAVAGAAILLLIVGIHNSWDSVTYIVSMRQGAEPRQPERTRPETKHEHERHR